MSKLVNKRLSNKIIWALGDITALGLDAARGLDWCIERAKLKCADPALLLRLAEINGHIVEIRLLSASARNGEYAGTGRGDGN